MCVSSGAAGVGGRFWGYRHRRLVLGIAPAVSSSPEPVCGVCWPLAHPPPPPAPLPLRLTCPPPLSSSMGVSLPTGRPPPSVCQLTVALTLPLLSFPFH